MITYEQIKSANERVARVEIRGKKYACVAERVQAFREICPNGSIETSVQLIPDDKGYICLATSIIKGEDGKTLAQDNAYEREGSTQINRTSYIENACTSAIGRALAALGLGSETSMASAEEMANALYQQEHREPEDDEKARAVAVAVCQKLFDTATDAVKEKCRENLKGREIGTLDLATLGKLKLWLVAQQKITEAKK